MNAFGPSPARNPLTFPTTDDMMAALLHTLPFGNLIVQEGTGEAVDAVATFVETAARID